MDAAYHMTPNIVHAKKRDVFVVLPVMLECIIVAQTMNNSFLCSIIVWLICWHGLYDGSGWWVGLLVGIVLEDMWWLVGGWI